MIPVHPIDPGETTELTIPMISPGETGCFSGQWRLANISNNFFGGKFLLLMTLGTVHMRMIILTNSAKKLEKKLTPLPEFHILWKNVEIFEVDVWF